MAQERFLVFGSPSIEEAEIDEVLATLKSGWIGTGPRVALFEREFAAYKGVPHAVGASSCTAALHLSILAAGIGPGDEVITTALTFCATVNAILHAGATPVLVDVEPVTMNMDAKAVEAAVGPQTRAILPVHFAGRPCDMEALGRVAERHRLKVIEDCAHAVEAKYRGRHVGTIGDFGCFSFYVTKNVTTGEGGMVLARRPEDAGRIRVLSLHGMSKDAWKRFGEEGYQHYDVVECGFKYNMTDLQAAIGIHQLRKVETRWERRRQLWETYQQELADLPLILPALPDPEMRHAYHLYTVLADERVVGLDRDSFLNSLTAQGIGVGVHYLSVPEHSYYRRRLGWTPEDYPNAMRIGRQTVSLPLSAKLTDEDLDRVVQAVRLALRMDRT